MLNEQNPMKYGSKDGQGGDYYGAVRIGKKKALKHEYQQIGIKSCAVDYGGDFITSIMKIIERQWFRQNGRCHC